MSHQTFFTPYAFALSNTAQRFRSTTYGMISHQIQGKNLVDTRQQHPIHDWMRLSATCPFAVLQTIRPVRHPASTRDAAQRRGVRTPD